MEFLIVDDSKFLQIEHQKIVKELGYTVIDVCDDGVKGLESYKKYLPDYVLSDIDMPNMNGIEMTNKIIEFDCYAKVILVSSFEKDQMLSQGIISESLECIKKPLTKEKLQEVLKYDLSRN